LCSCGLSPSLSRIARLHTDARFNVSPLVLSFPAPLNKVAADNETTDWLAPSKMAQYLAISKASHATKFKLEYEWHKDEDLSLVD
jgi:hypothetical protein